MKLTYDPRYNVAYLRLQDKTAQVETIRVSDELLVDIAPDGTVYGIELLNANTQLCGGDEGALVIVNEALGKRRAVALSEQVHALLRAERDLFTLLGPVAAMPDAAAMGECLWS